MHNFYAAYATNSSQIGTMDDNDWPFEVYRFSTAEDRDRWIHYKDTESVGLGLCEKNGDKRIPLSYEGACGLLNNDFTKNFTHEIAGCEIILSPFTYAEVMRKIV